MTATPSRPRHSNSPARGLTLARMLGAFACAVVALSLAAAPARAAGEDRYRVGPGDVLSVSILGQPDLSGEVTVREGGAITIHLLGTMDVAGLTIEEIEALVLERAGEVFQGHASVVAEIASFREIYVMGEVQNPGGYEYAPGMTVVRAVAAAGGYRRLPLDPLGGDMFRIDQAQQQVSTAETRIAFARADLDAVEAELARLDAEANGAGGAERNPATEQERLVGLRHAILSATIDSATQQRSLALDEARSFTKRRELIERQLELVEERLAAMQNLVDRGLARREEILELQVNADEYRSDSLEAVAFEARAQQTAANADSEIAIVRAEYRRELVADRVRLEEELAVAEAARRTGLALLRRMGGMDTTLGLDDLSPVFEIYRPTEGGTERLPAELSTRLRPEDVLSVEMKSLTQ